VSGLCSISSIKFFKKAVKCQKCLVYKLIENLDKKFIYREGNFERMKLTGLPDCLFIEKIFNGSQISDKDYKKLESCTFYTEKLTWEGLTEKFIKGIGSIINYIFLSSNKRITPEAIFTVIKDIGDSSFQTTEEKATTLENQFAEERANYELFEKLRSLIVVG